MYNESVSFWETKIPLKLNLSLKDYIVQINYTLKMFFSEKLCYVVLNTIILDKG